MHRTFTELYTTRCREVLAAVLDQAKCDKAVIPLAVVKAFVAALCDFTPRTRPPSMYWTRAEPGKSAGLAFDNAHHFDSVWAEFYVDEPTQAVWCEYDIDHDHWTRAEGVFRVEEFTKFPYVVCLELQQPNYQWTPEQEAIELAEAKRRQAEFDALVERETKGMTPQQRMGWILGYPLRHEVLYESISRKLVKVEKLPPTEAVC